MNQRRLVVVFFISLLLLLFVLSVEAFIGGLPRTGTTSHFGNYLSTRASKFQVRRRSFPPLLKALIYMPDGTVVDDDDEEDDQGPSEDNYSAAAATSTTAATTTTTLLADKDDYNDTTPDWMEALARNRADVLARLAVAFAPPQHENLQLHQLEGVQILRVEERHMELQVVVRQQQEGGGGGGGDDQQCVVALHIPIAFPRPCFSTSSSFESMEECVLQNLQELDVQARETIQRVDAIRQLEDESDTIEPQLPSWWIHATNDEAMEAECAFLRQYLNDQLDVQHDLCSLAASHSSISLAPNTFDRATVVAIGPLGLVVRAMSIAANDDDPATATTTTRIVDVPVRFPAPATTSDKVRESVLSAIEAASTFVVQEEEEEAVVPVAALEEASLEIPEPAASIATVPEPQPGIVAGDEETTAAPIARDYSEIEDLGERAFQILVDLGMVELHLDPSDPNYDHSLDDEIAPGQINKNK